MSNKDRHQQLLAELAMINHKLGVLLDILQPELKALSQKEIKPGDPSTYPTGFWPEGTPELVKKELARIQEQQQGRLSHDVQQCLRAFE